MCQAMILKDMAWLDEVLDDSFVPIHMTGMRQSKQAFIPTVNNGTFTYYSAVHENVLAEVKCDTVIAFGSSYVIPVVFGGSKSQWRLQQKCSLKRVNGMVFAKLLKV